MFIPFVLYSFTRFEGLWKWIALCAVVISLSAILFISSRTALLSSIVILCLYFGYSVFNYYKTRERLAWVRPGFVVLAVLIAFFVATNSNRIDKKQSNSISTLYDVSSSELKKGVIDTTVTNQSFSSGSGRIIFYKTGLKDFKSAPIQGLGLANWKLEDKSDITKKGKQNGLFTPQNLSLIHI